MTSDEQGQARGRGNGQFRTGRGRCIEAKENGMYLSCIQASVGFDGLFNSWIEYHKRCGMRGGEESRKNAVHQVYQCRTHICSIGRQIVSPVMTPISALHFQNSVALGSELHSPLNPRISRSYPFRTCTKERAIPQTFAAVRAPPAFTWILTYCRPSRTHRKASTFRQLDS